MPIDILMAETEDEARKKMARVMELNDRRKLLQREAEEEAEADFLSRGRQPYAFVYSKNFHKGVIGLVATKIANKYGVPAFVGALMDNGEIVGSARAPNFDALSTLKAYEATSDNMISFGGHHFASCFKIDVSQADKWSKALKSHYSEIKQEKVELKYDVEATLKELNQDTMQWLDSFQPFGVGFEAPTFMVKDCLIKDLRGLRGGHLRLNLKQANSSQTALYFSPPSHIDFTEGDRIDALVDLQWNYYNGRKSLQLLVKDMRLHEG